MLVLVLVGALVTGHLTPKAVTGEAVLGPIPGPPKVGACVVQDPGDQGWAYNQDTELATIPSLQFDEDCEAPHYGEVVAVLPALPPQHTAPQASTAAGGPGYEMWRQCPGSANQYLGPYGISTLVSSQESGWATLATAYVSFAGPNRLQTSFGQTWVACLVLAPMTSDVAAQNVYDGSLRNAVQTGRVPPNFTQCSSELTESTVPTTCTGAHTVEFLAYGSFVGGRATSVPPATSCLALVKELTRMPDVTAGGRLKVVPLLQRVDSDGQPQTMDGPLKSGSFEYGTCAVQVVGAGKLTGTLIGLGTNPVPWTG